MRFVLCNHVLRSCFGRKYWESESGKMGEKVDVESMIDSGVGSNYETLVADAKDKWDVLLAPKVGTG